MISKKFSKRFLACLCALIMLFTSVSFVQAANTEESDGVIVKIYTPEEFYAHYKEVTGQEYPNKIPTTRGSIYNKYVTVTQNEGAGYKVEVGCLVEVGCGQSCSWNRIVPGTTYSIATGGGNYTWNEGNSYATLSGDKKRITFNARGVIEVAATESMTAGLSAAGFTLSTSVGSTYYYRKTVTVNQTVNQ